MTFAPIIRWAAIAACAALCACASAPEPPAAQTVRSAGDPAAGRALVGDLCATCHAVGARGESPDRRAPPLRTVLSRYDAERLTQVLQQGDLMGSPDLPHVYLSEQSARDTVAYLREMNASAP